MMNRSELYTAGDVVNYLGIPSVVIGFASSQPQPEQRHMVFAISLKDATIGKIWSTLPYGTTRSGFMNALGYRDEVTVFDAARPLQRLTGRFNFGVPQDHLSYLSQNLMPGALVDRNQLPSVVTGHFVGHRDGRCHVVLTCRCEDGGQRGCVSLADLAFRPERVLRQGPTIVYPRPGLA